MRDFASASMIKLIAASLTGKTLAPLTLPTSSGPYVEMSGKTDLLNSALSELGPEVILRIGEEIPRFKKDPMIIALLKAESATDLLRRWKRLERFAHSKNRLEFCEITHNQILITHLSKSPTSPPTQAENLLIFGIIFVLLEQLTGSPVRVSASGTASCEPPREWRGNKQIHHSAAIEIHYGENSRSDTREYIQTTSLLEIESLMSELIAADPLRRLSLAKIANELGQSKRNLQRKLQEKGETFSSVLARVRAGFAAKMLINSDQSLSEIGFFSGYSDQAHFTRGFRQATAMTPLVYRESFRIK